MKKEGLKEREKCIRELMEIDKNYMSMRLPRSFANTLDEFWTQKREVLKSREEHRESTHVECTS